MFGQSCWSASAVTDLIERYGTDLKMIFNMVISATPLSEPEQLSLELWMSDLIQYIIRESGRPGYFCGVEMYYLPDTLTHFLYNEGLLLRYSPKPYDNIASTKKIVETKYHLEYLNEPEFTPSNKHPEYEGMQLNYVMMLSHLIPFYRADGEKEKALWLQQLLTDVINNTQVNENFKRHCFQILDENTNLDENTK